MSTSTTVVAIPEWDLADRLAKALRVANMSVQEMADYLDVHRNTVSAWINGRTPPSTQSIRLWAIRTNVPYEWLIEGIQFNSRSSLLPRLDSNQEPVDCWPGIYLTAAS